MITLGHPEYNPCCCPFSALPSQMKHGCRMLLGMMVRRLIRTFARTSGTKGRVIAQMRRGGFQGMDVVFYIWNSEVSPSHLHYRLNVSKWTIPIWNLRFPRSALLSSQRRNANSLRSLGLLVILRLLVSWIRHYKPHVHMHSQLTTNRNDLKYPCFTCSLVNFNVKLSLNEEQKLMSQSIISSGRSPDGTLTGISFRSSCPWGTWHGYDKRRNSTKRVCRQWRWLWGNRKEEGST